MEMSPRIILRPEEAVHPDAFATSQSALDREFQLLGEFNNIDFYIRTSVDGSMTVRGLDRYTNDAGRRPIVYEMHLVTFDKFNYNGLQCKQVIRVWTKHVNRAGGLASYAYTKLVSAGYTIVSDKDQLVGGAMLWKSFIRSAKYPIMLIDLFNKTEELVTPDTDLSIIWSTEPDNSKRQKLLVMFNHK